MDRKSRCTDRRALFRSRRVRTNPADSLWPCCLPNFAAFVGTLSYTRIVIVATLGVLIAGCSGSGRVRYDTPAEAYTKGKEYYDAGKYTRAVEYLQGAFDFGRAHEYAADAQLLLARSHRQNGDFLLSSNEYQRFIQIYRSDERVEQASFEYAMTFIDRSPRYELDQTDTERAARELQLFIDRYPESEHVGTAASEITELREKLALKAFESAKLYERREIYQAAAVSFAGVFDEYPDTSWADDALLGAVRNFIAFSEQSVAGKQAERYQEAVENFERLRQLFPDSALVAEAERLVDASAYLAAR